MHTRTLGQGLQVSAIGINRLGTPVLANAKSRRGR